MKFKAKLTKDAIEDNSSSAGASKYMNKSGVYDAVIKFASVSTSAKGAEQIVFNFDLDGVSQTIYGPYVTNTDGKENTIGANLIRKLAVIAGMGEDDDFTLEDEEHPVGKEQTLKEFSVITDFTELPVKVRVQEEYSLWEGNIRKNMVIKSFFSEEGASASEIADGTEVGKRLALETEKYASHVTYKNDLTEEDVKEWVKAQMDAKKGDSGEGDSPKAAKTAPKATKAAPKLLFGKKAV